jgi:cysteine desulfurase
LPVISPTYFDYAAATPLDDDVRASMEPYLSDRFYNPSAQYQSAVDVRKAVDEARARVAHHFGAKQSEIIFTAGGTEADNLAIHGVMRRFPDTNLVVSAVEHEAVMEPAKQYNCRILPVKPDGRVDIAKLESLIDGRTVLVSVMLANNEVGTVQPVREIARLLQAIRKKRSRQDNPLPLYFHTDACQAAGLLDIHASRLGVDMMTINGGKIYGPKQSGALFVSSFVRLSPLIHGGGQERGLLSGTENVPGIIGLAAALDKVQEAKVEESKRLGGLQKLFYTELKMHIPQATVTGSTDQRLPNNVHVIIPGADNERLLYGLDSRGVQAATGSACSAADTEPSRVLTAMGVREDDARGSLRFSLGRFSTEDGVRSAVSALASLL